MFGKALISILLAVSASSAAIYLVKSYLMRGIDISQYNPKRDLALSLARFGMFAVFAGIIMASGFLMFQIINHNFSFAYVFSYSSRQMPFALLLSAFYAGQEGSILLWLLFFALSGYFLFPQARKRGYELHTMGFFMLIVSFLLLLLMLKSPFNFFWESFPAGAKPGMYPQEGRGMNPILENYWMVIHPPILFLGYTFLAIPFVFALSALFRGEYDKWIELAKPWVLASGAVLGAGLMLGGFWAYETLGWGGFWGWDPVENSSLVPWIVIVALTHTLLVQSKNGALKRTNLALALSAFCLVVYAVFLTRSGVLSDASVHSFSDPGKGAFAVLLVFLVSISLMSAIPLIVRFKGIRGDSITTTISSREFSFALGTAFLVALAALVIIGTSMPILTKIASGAQGSAIDTDFYNEWTLPIAIVLLLTSTLSVFLNWSRTGLSQFLRRLLPSFVVALVATVWAVTLGVHGFANSLLLLVAFWSVVANIELILRKLWKTPRKIGAYLSHIGIAVMMLGVLGSGILAESKTISLVQGEPQDVLGLRLSFSGSEELKLPRNDRQTFAFNIGVDRGGERFTICPEVYYSDFNSRREPFFEPGIDGGFREDIYISPKSSDNKYQLLLLKDVPAKLPIDTSTTIRLGGFDIAEMGQSDQDSSITVGAIVYYRSSECESADTLVTLMNLETMECRPVWKTIAGTKYLIGFTHFRPDQSKLSMSQVELSIAEGDPTSPKLMSAEVFTVEVSRKPWVSLVWAGVVLVVIGYFWAIAKKNKNDK